MPRSAAAILNGSVPRPLRPVLAVPRALRAFLGLWRATLIGAYRDGILGYAKGAAYSALLAFFPLLATAATILVRTRAAFVSDAITNFLSQILPPGTEDMVFNYFAVRGAHPTIVPVTAMLVSVLASSGVIVSLMQGFKAVYRIPTGRPFFRERLIAILLVFSAAIPALAASALIVLGSRVEKWAVRALGLLPATADWRGWVPTASASIRVAIALGAIAAGTMILYRYGPNRPQKWRLVWPGAVLATLLWFGATLGFTWYVRNLANYNVMYGGIATAILLLVWMYVLAVIALLGCEFNAAWERLTRPS